MTTHRSYTAKIKDLDSTADIAWANTLAISDLLLDLSRLAECVSLMASRIEALEDLATDPNGPPKVEPEEDILDRTNPDCPPPPLGHVAPVREAISRARDSFGDISLTSLALVTFRYKPEVVNVTKNPKSFVSMLSKVLNGDWVWSATHKTWFMSINEPRALALTEIMLELADD